MMEYMKSTYEFIDRDGDWMIVIDYKGGEKRKDLIGRKLEPNSNKILADDYL